VTFPTGGTSGAPIDLVSLAGAPSSAGLVDYLVDPTLSPNPSQRIFADLGAACDAALADGNPAKITVRGNVTTALDPSCVAPPPCPWTSPAWAPTW